MQAINVVPGVPGVRNPYMQLGENVPIFEERNYTFVGITKDETGAAFGGCTVKLFNQATNILEQTTTSDASGNYSFVVDKTQVYYMLAYHAGAPDKAGTTVNTLMGS